MANNDNSAIKAGVNGMIDDAPAPEAEEAPGTTTMMSEPEAPAAEQAAPAADYGGTSYANYGQDENASRIHEVAEAIINEKWQELLSSVGNIAVWKEKTDTNIVSIKQEIVRINERFDNLQNAILGKVKEYDNDMRSVHTEMQALEKVFERIMEPLTINVKELNKLTKELKELKEVKGRI